MIFSYPKTWIFLGFLTIPKPTRNTHVNEEIKEFQSTNPANNPGSSSSSPTEGVKLKKNVDLFSGIALIVGTMIGSGIFVSPTGLLERTGSITYSLIVWGLCGVVSMFGMLCISYHTQCVPISLENLTAAQN